MKVSMRITAARLSGIASMLLLVSPLIATPAGAQSKPIYKDSKATMDARIDDLLSRMTPEE
ncbi:MAG: hypothetical protein ACJ8OJ_16130, partial [Povalibacter sp.]